VNLVKEFVSYNITKQHSNSIVIFVSDYEYVWFAKK